MIAQAPAVQFNELTHTYTLEGAYVPGVTSVLEDVGIIDYSAVPDGTRVRALERGRFVHTLCQFDDEGALDAGSIDERLAGYLEAWRRFRETHGFTANLIEHRGYSGRFRYAGTLDRRGALALGGSEILADIKTSVAPYWTAFQTAAYANFFENPASLRRMAVELHADGTFKVHEYRCADFAAHFNVFLAALTVFNAKRMK